MAKRLTDVPQPTRTISPASSIEEAGSFCGTMNQPTDDTAIRVNELKYSYPTGQTALKSVSFDVRSGERVGLVGPGGAGKSTLLMHLNGLLPQRLPAEIPSAAVTVAGVPLTRTALDRIRRTVGYVFQDPDDQLFCPTVREDVAFGPLNLGLSQEEARTRIADALDQVGLSGYEDRSTLQLSVGERKRVCLAGVLACHPQILVLDEPFANLDPRARRGLMEILTRFEGSQIIATHDLDLVVELCHRVVILDEGTVRADGASRDILSDQALVERHGLEVPWQLR